MLFLGAALPATQKLVVRPRAAKAQGFRYPSVGCRVCLYIPCDCMHEGKNCPQRNNTQSRSFAIDYMKSFAYNISLLPSMEYLGYVRNTRLLRR